MEGLSTQIRSYKSQNPHPKRVVLLTSILLLGRAQNSTNCFAQLLSLYLQGIGVKHQVLLLLHRLGLINRYRTLNCQKMGLAEHSKEGHNTSGGYTSANIVKDLPPINVHF